MLFRERFLDGIATGAVTLAFRRWVRPSVRAGGTLLTPVGQLEIVDVRRIAELDITEEDGRRAGYDSREALLMELHERDSGDLYRIEFGALRPDPRIRIRESAPPEEEAQKILARLRRLDAASGDG